MSWCDNREENFFDIITKQNSEIFNIFNPVLNDIATGFNKDLYINYDDEFKITHGIVSKYL